MKKKETESLTDEEAQTILRVPDRRTLQGKRDYAILLTLQLEAVILMAEVPSDPPIPCSALQGRGGKAQKGYPLISPEGNVPEGFTDFRQGTQVMMLLHQFLITLLFGWTNGPDKNLSQIQNGYPQTRYIQAPL